MVFLRHGWRKGGYLKVTDPDGASHRDHERDTYSCRHCQRIVEVPPMADPQTLGRWCEPCGGLLCVGCSAKQGCDSVMRKVEEVERRAALARMLGS